MPQGARQKKEPRLFGAQEVADCIGVRQSNFRVLPGLPEPYDTLAATTLWRANEIRGFAAERRKRLNAGRSVAA